MRRPGWPAVDGFTDDDVDEDGLVATLDDDAAAAASPDALVDSLELPDVSAEAPPPQFREPPGADGPPPMPAPAPRYFDDIAAERNDIEQGAAQDRMSRMIRGIEMGAKQLTAGVLQQPMAQLVSPESTNYEGIARKRADVGEAKRYQRSQGEIAAAHKKAMLERQGKLDEARAAKDRADAERQAARDTKGDVEKDEDQEIRRKQNEAMLALAGANLGIAREGMGIRKEEHGAKVTETKQKLDALSIPLGSGTLQVKPGVGDTGTNQARTQAGLYNAAFAGMDDVDSALGALARAKTPVALANAKADLESKVQATATALNSAFGQGAMADNERKNVIGALGADVFSLDGIRAFVGQDPSVLQRRLRSLRAITEKGAVGRLRVYGDYAPAGGGSDEVSLINTKTGESFSASPDLAKRLIEAGKARPK